MHLIGALLVAPRSASPLVQTPAIVNDTVWLLATAADGLEHVRVHTGVYYVTLVLFLRSADSATAEHTGRLLCERLVATVPFLAGWQVRECWPLDPPEERPDGLSGRL